VNDADPSEETPAPDRDGPFDESDSHLWDSSITRLDLGSLRVPGLPGVEVQVEADQQTQAVRAVTAVLGDGAVQMQPFAAPRSTGIWDELRAEMLQELADAADAEATEADGEFGPELRAVVPARGPQGETIRQHVRFTGVDGPRWFLRVVFLGRAAVEPNPEDALHRLVRQTVVVRGSDPMAPRDPLPLRLPADDSGSEPPSQSSQDS
jgi:hypothetical protein